MATKWSDPAPKYGPTAEYGGCEADGCSAGARTTCAKCKAHVCFGHAAHAAHEDHATHETASSGA